MSFILEALRKADATRQELPRPVPAVLQPVHRPRALAARVWIMPATLVFVGVAAAALFLTRTPPEVSESPGTRVAAAQPQLTAAPPSRVSAPLSAPVRTEPVVRTPPPVRQAPGATPMPRSSPQPAPAESAELPQLAVLAEAANTAHRDPAERASVRPLALEPGVAPPPQAVAEAPAASGPTRVTPGTVEVRDLMADEPAPVVAAATTPGTVRVETPRQAATRPVADVPTIDQVILAGSLNVPELRLDMHVYNEDPARRFVYINARRYREGDDTPEGVGIDDIRRDGVVLRYKRQRFLLTPR